MSLIHGVSPYVASVFVAAALFLTYFYKRLTEQRALLDGLPQPPNAGLLGHLKILGSLTREYPQEVHPHSYLHLIREKYNMPDAFYADAWPLGWPMLAISDPQIATQALQLPKHESLGMYFQHIAGAHALITMEGKEWKKWRSIFNPGFSHAHLMTLVPGIIEDTLTFCEILEEHAERRDVFRLEELATCLTVDVIGRIVLDARFNAQRSTNPFIKAMKDQVSWVDTKMSLNPLSRWNPIRPLMLYMNTRKMERYMGDMLEARVSSKPEFQDGQMKRKHVIDLALETYRIEEGQTTKNTRPSLDPVFKRYAIDQLRTFFFAGHDTTSSTICWCYYVLSKDLSALRRVLNEHEEIFGPSPNDALRLLRENPQLISKLEYTSAVIKEVLRLYPSASSLRQGAKDFYLYNPKTGEKLPTDGFLVWINHVNIHRNANLWDAPNEFRPERFHKSDWR